LSSSEAIALVKLWLNSDPVCAEREN